MGLYEDLFKKDHLRDGDVIGMAEHGRVGGLSTGQPFKYTSPIERSLPTEGNNGSYTVTEVLVGTVTTTTIEKVIGVTTYTKTVVEDTSTGVTTVSSWA